VKHSIHRVWLTLLRRVSHDKIQVYSRFHCEQLQNFVSFDGLLLKKSIESQKESIIVDYMKITQIFFLLQDFYFQFRMSLKQFSRSCQSNDSSTNNTHIIFKRTMESLLNGVCAFVESGRSHFEEKYKKY
jgi:hypothetical protein